MGEYVFLRGHIMSSHTQNSPTQTTVDGGQANFETALRIATVIVEASQRLFKLQSEAANAAFAENSKHLMSSLSTKDSGALLGEWAGLYEANTRRMLDVTRSCFEIMPQTQAEIANLMGGPFASANKETQQYLDQFTKAMSDGRDAAAASVKEFLAKAVARLASPIPGRKKRSSLASAVDRDRPWRLIANGPHTQVTGSRLKGSPFLR